MYAPARGLAPGKKLTLAIARVFEITNLALSIFAGVSFG
jgi:hypothetical protein